MQSQWEKGHGEENRDTAQVCGDRVKKTMAQVEQDLAGDVKSSNTRFCQCRGQKERPRRE